MYLHIGKKTENTMLALSVEHKKDGRIDIEELPFFITRTAVNRYFNIRYEDIEKDTQEKDRGFIFVKYSFPDENTLILHQFDPEVIKSAVKSGKLKGEIYYRENKTTPTLGKAGKVITTPKRVIDSVKITDTSENMVKFFNTEGNKYIAEVLKFVRVHPVK